VLGSRGPKPSETEVTGWLHDVVRQKVTTAALIEALTLEPNARNHTKLFKLALPRLKKSRR